MTRRYTLSALLLLLFGQMWAQPGAEKKYDVMSFEAYSPSLDTLPCTEKKYDWWVEENLVYGKDVNYLGDSTVLRLDLYKPIGDGNTKRPLIVVVHGGYMLTGCKAGVKWFAEEMVARGYVVAAVDYRKGWHKSGYAKTNCLGALLSKPLQLFQSLYVADSAEHYRALYRGMQDVKGAIRWLKARAVQDSVDHTKVFLGGESAGALISLTVVFLDRPEEKPLSCGAISPAPKPFSPTANYFEGPGCKRITKNPKNSQLQRPDLGPIEGRLNLNGHDTKVLGVFSFYGALPYEAHSKNWLKGGDIPEAIYLYHRTCDGGVPFMYGQVLDVISTYCNTGCSPWHTKGMHIFGNGAIASALKAMPHPPEKLVEEFFYCPPFNPNQALSECLRYKDNGAYHNILDKPQRAQKIAELFANLAACPKGATQEAGLSERVRVQPNPFEQELSVWVDTPITGEATWWLTDLSGRVIWSAQRSLPMGRHILVDHNALPPGVYVLHLRSAEGSGVWKVLRQ